MFRKPLTTILIFLMAFNGCGPGFRQWPLVERSIGVKQDVMGSRPDPAIVLEKHPDVSGFTLPLNGGFNARSLFDEKSDTIRRRSIVQSGRYQVSFLMELDNEGQVFSQGFKQIKGLDYKMYWRGQDAFIYGQEIDKDKKSGLKEWSWVNAPNRKTGSEYVWTLTSDDENKHVRLEPTDQGIAVYLTTNQPNQQHESNQPNQPVETQHIASQKEQPNTQPNKPRRVRNPMSALGDLWNPFANTDDKPMAVIQAPIYWTKDGIEGKHAKINILFSQDGQTRMAVSIHEDLKNYPLLVDPSLSYGQWVGGDGGESAVQALALDIASGDEIYAGGWSTGLYWTLPITFAGTHSGTEGFVVEVADGASPSIAWGQWLGGTSLDQVLALAVTADEIYVGGWAGQTISMEGISAFAGTGTGGFTESFVIELADGTAPSIAWGQWLGGTTQEQVFALALLADEIYAGGSLGSTVSMEAISAFAGTGIASGTEGFVVELADGTAPSIAWGQWLGGSINSTVSGMAVVGDEIYAGGYTVSSVSMEAITAFAGSAVATEAFVVEIADGTAPSIAWGQWVGGTAGDEIVALAVVGDEIYAGGYLSNSINVEGVSAFAGTGYGAIEGFIVEIADGTAPSIAWGQWLGGSIGTNNVVYALAVTADEIYAGGYVQNSDYMEAVSAFIGSVNATEGFVVEIADGVTPSIAWGQWLGGTGDDYVLALAVNGDEVYAGGWFTGSTSMEGMAVFGGVYANGTAAFMTEITDGGTTNRGVPTFSWGQWVGAGGGPAVVRALALDLASGNEIYAGGESYGPTWTGSTVNFTGTFNPETTSTGESFVMEVADGVAPSIAWGQWLGGTAGASVLALAVTADEIYAGGANAGTISMEGITAYAGTSISTEGFVIELADGGTPSIAWGQWLGGGNSLGDFVFALAVNADEIYAGGSVTNTDSMEALSAFAGSVTQGNSLEEGFVVELADGTAPSIAWGQWLGGTSIDLVTSVVVNGDEIYAGGYALDTISMEGISAFAGTAGVTESFVIEIADGTAPSIVWGQWLGGTAHDRVYALAVTGDEIYAGGLVTDSISMEAISAFSGTILGTDGFVVELADGTAPSIAWGQWLGGTSNDQVLVLAVSDDEIYAGGFISETTNEGIVSFIGTLVGTEAYIAEIADGVAPTIVWGQFLGGSASDQTLALAINGDEIYAGGYVVDTLGGFESMTAFVGSTVGGSAGFLIEITDGTTQTTPQAGFSWGQWLGGAGGEGSVQALALDSASPDEIYAGGWITGDVWTQSVAFSGTLAATEGFVLEIADGVAPSIAWGQYLGGTGTDQVLALAVVDNEIYAGGWADISIEAMTGFAGTNYLTDSFVVELADGATPSIAWGQWLGGTTADQVLALAVTADEIYAGGWVGITATMEGLSAFAGTADNTESFVVELADGTAPSIAWGQWLGSSALDQVAALAVTADEIYAGGHTFSSVSMEAITAFAGSAVATEAFVVEIADGTAPSIAWGQWLGGTATDQVLALVLTADEIYAGGFSSASASMEATSAFAGTFQNGSGQGFVIEIADGTAPSIVWGQWLGGQGGNVVNVLAVTGDEIYAGGYSINSVDLEAISAFVGITAGTEGFVVEIADGTAPSIAWGQWFGGDWDDIVYALVIVDDEIYVGGYVTSTIGMESMTAFTGTHAGGYMSFMTELADSTASKNTASLTWGQWLGGASTDQITALALTGDEIYAGGWIGTTISMEAISAFAGTGTGATTESFVVEIADGVAPSIAWGQWLGGSSSDQILALAVTADEIYVGGWAGTTISMEAISAFAGTGTGASTEAFVVEIADGTAPSIAWGQWLGGTAEDNVLALALTDDEIYAGGFAGTTISMEAISAFAGTGTGAATEAFVVEIADGTAPSIAWGQWLGGTAADQVAALAVTDDEIYAGGWAGTTISMEAISAFAGTGTGANTEAFVVEIADGTAPSITWGQWLGGTATDQVLALVLTADEIYAGGFAIDTISMEAISAFAGLADGTEGFVLELADGVAPSIAWGQWIGGVSIDIVDALAITGDEIYAGGYVTFTSGIEGITTFIGSMVGRDGFVVEIADGTAPCIAWGQYLGGTSLDGHNVLTLAVNGNEIYAGGYEAETISMEGIGSFSGTADITEGFVVEINDATVSVDVGAIAYGQFLGGGLTEVNNRISALAVTADEIYAGGVAKSYYYMEALSAFAGTLIGPNDEGFVVEIADGVTPSIAWGQWLGGTSNDYVLALAVTDNEIYAGGQVMDSVSMEAISAFAGTASLTEAYLVEIADGSSPSIAWGQWLGGINSDSVNALAVTDDEIYAGGSVITSNSMEAISAFAGSHSGFSEGFVVELADGTAPSIAWGQWLGGTTNDSVFALAVVEDEIYAGGFIIDTISMEATSAFAGTASASESFIVEIADGTAPSIAWGQWFGGTLSDQVLALALTGDEVYAGGDSTQSASTEAPTAFAGTFVGDEGFVLELADGTAPSIAWGLWLGGTLADAVQALNVLGNEIYVGGYMATSIGMENVTMFTGCFVGGSEGFVMEIADGTAPSISWAQWLGGSNSDAVLALAVNGNEIYAGGYALDTVSMDGIANFAGTGGMTEAFVAELTDTTVDIPAPAIAYGQWVGSGNLETSNVVYALAVTGDEIYAGGVMDSIVNMEAISAFAGTLVSIEGFVMEIADGASPSIAWGQWLGGTSTDQVLALLVTGDEIYAGGWSLTSPDMEAISAFAGTHNGNSESFVVEIADGASPSIAWGQWLGGTGWDQVFALAVTADEIYAGGYSTETLSMEAISAFAGSLLTFEGFVVELADGTAPSIAWGQWLGGAGSDEVNGLAVIGDEIYVGGTVANTISMETLTSFAGTVAGTSEGFILEIADGTAPSIAWGQWLGGSSVDKVYALAVNGDEIYAGGFVADTISMEAISAFAGTSFSYDGFVVEIADGVAPSIAWGQWLGGLNSDYVYALLVNGDEIYAGGAIESSGSVEGVTAFQGAYDGASEGFVMEIADGVSPSIAWGRWLGGTGSDIVYALAINGDEIYAGGFVTKTLSMDNMASFSGTHLNSEGFVVEIGDSTAVVEVPVIAYGEILGGGGPIEANNVISAMAITGDEIYTGGYTNAMIFEGLSAFAGTLLLTEGFVMEIADGVSPSIAWGQWLGGNSNDQVNTLAVTGNEIYAGGFAGQTISMEAISVFVGTGTGANTEAFVVEIADGTAPSIAWGQWLGGTGIDQVLALAVTGNEIYAGGYVNDTVSMEAAASFVGTANSTDGFIVELADGTNPSIPWGQWLGGATEDRVLALAVTSNEIYAGGWAGQTISMEAVSAFAGTGTGAATEAFLVEIADGTAPSIAWGQWLGGTGTDNVLAMAKSGNEIYAAGYVIDTISMEAISAFAGTAGKTESFVVEIADGTAPSITWGQWLGGTDDDEILAMAVTANEIYVAGYISTTIGMEAVSAFAGTIAATESFVIEIADGVAPSIAWGMWFGGTASDQILALAVTAGEIYAGGFAIDSIGMEEIGSFAGTAGYTEAFIVEITDDALPIVPNPSTDGLFFGLDF